MTDQEALEAVRKAISPESLSHVQEVVFIQSWSGQLYPEIAKAVGYHPEYIRDVGAQLWRSLSDSIGQKVTKKNVRFVLNTLSANNLLPTGTDLNSIGYANDSQANSLQTDSLQTDCSQVLHSQVDDLLRTQTTTTQLAFPSVGLSVKSALYVPRSPAEEQTFSELNRPGGLLRIKAPSNTGKTSLLLRALDYARTQGARTVLINMQEADTAILNDLGRFLRWFCRNTAKQLGIENRLDDYWDDEIGHKVSCKIYFREYLLTQVSEPIVLALDEVDQLFEYPTLVQDFLPMLRVWHEEAMELAIWQKLRLALAYNTEVYVPLKISQSPFNIGLSVQLPMLSLAQTTALAEQYNLPSSRGVEAEPLAQLHQLVSGHPYLIQLALYWLSEREITLASLLQDAHTQSGIYSAHLRRHWQIMQRQPELKGALAKVLTHREQGAQIDTFLAYQLERMGLVHIVGNAAVINSDLYSLYFKGLLLA
jgi:AAA-like domain